MITPLNNRVIIKKTVADNKSAGGIIIPESETEKPTTGIVIASASAEIEAGNTVLFSKYAGIEMKINGEEVLIVKFDELIAKVG
jgi:chaperonin GroES